ncbi:MAG: hypothetical protein LC107_09710 [Chitinophagales bacterium]|nr:hypothetical protein [Chitinophagales bacterium]
MKFTGRRLLSFLFIFCSGVVLLSGQDADSRKTEREIKVEDQFVQVKLLEISGKTDQAIKLLDTIRRTNPNNGTIYFELAKLYYSKKDWEQTEANLSQAKKAQPTQTAFVEFEVEYLLSQNRRSEATMALQGLIDLKPSDINYYRNLIDVQKQDKHYADALATIQKMEANLGSTEETSRQKAEILVLDGKAKEAVQVLDGLAAKNPNSTSILKRIVSILQAENLGKETQPYLQKILDIDPHDSDAKLGLLLLTNKNIKEDEKLITLYPLIKNPNINIDAKIVELMPFLEKQMATDDSLLNNQLIDVGDMLTLAHPNEAKAHAFYADVLKNSGNITAAIRQYERTLELNKNIFSVWEQLMYCLNATEDFDKLDILANEAMDYFPNAAISYCFAAKAALKKNNYKKMASLLDEAQLISAGNPIIETRIWTIRAESELQQKNLVKATENIQQALTASQNQSADAWEVNGDIALAKNQPKEAISLWKKALQFGGNKSRIEQKLATIKNP